jgi:hypothetical protein
MDLNAAPPELVSTCPKLCLSALPTVCTHPSRGETCRPAAARRGWGRRHGALPVWAGVGLGGIGLVEFIGQAAGADLAECGGDVRVGGDLVGGEGNVSATVCEPYLWRLTLFILVDIMPLAELSDFCPWLCWLCGEAVSGLAGVYGGVTFEREALPLGGSWRPPGLLALYAEDMADAAAIACAGLMVMPSWAPDPPPTRCGRDSKYSSRSEKNACLSVDQQWTGQITHPRMSSWRTLLLFMECGMHKAKVGCNSPEWLLVDELHLIIAISTSAHPPMSASIPLFFDRP